MGPVAVIALALAVSPADSQRAAKLAHRSIIEYNAGDFPKALADATAAYELYPRAALLYNLGQCHRALGNNVKALFFYRGYLREYPDAHNRAAVLSLIRELEEQLHPAAPVVAPVVVVAPPPPAPPPVQAAPPLATEPVPAAAIFAEEKPARPLPGSVWWLGGSAVACGVAGTVLGFLASSNLSGDAPSPAGPYTVHHVSPSAFEAGQNEGLTADILWGAGGALLVSAVIVALTR